MTPSEAVQKAIDGHEFRHYAPAIMLPRSGHSPADAVSAVCWCGQFSPPYPDEKAARDAHGRHQARLALMRSFGHWDT